MNNFVPHFIMDVITSPCCDYSYSMLVKGRNMSQEQRHSLDAGFSVARAAIIKRHSFRPCWNIWVIFMVLFLKVSKLFITYVCNNSKHLLGLPRIHSGRKIDNVVWRKFLGFSLYMLNAISISLCLHPHTVWRVVTIDLVVSRHRNGEHASIPLTMIAHVTPGVWPLSEKIITQFTSNLV